MNRKIMSAFIILSLLASLFIPFTALAEGEVENLLVNGSFEEEKGDWTPAWELLGDGVKGENAEISDKDAADGDRSLRFYGKSSSVFVAQLIENTAPETDFTFTGKVKYVKKGENWPQIKVTYFSPDGYGSYNTVEEPAEVFKVGVGKWTEVSFTSTAPKNCTRISLLVRLVGGGECYWDDVKFTGRRATSEELAAAQKAATELHLSEDAGPVASPSPSQLISYTSEGNDTYNFVKNGDFEVVNTKGLPTGFSLTGGKVGENIVVSTEDPYEGNNSVRFYGTSSNIFISQMLYGLLPGEAYKVTAALKVVKPGGQSFVKFEFQDENNQVIGEAGCDFKKAWKDGVWSLVEDKVEIPAGTARVSMLVRLVGGGECYWDDVKVIGKASDTMAAKVYYAEEFSETVSEEVIEDPTAYKPPYGNTGNLLTNADFEAVSGNALSGWSSRTGFGTATSCAFVETEQVHSGSTALKLVDTTGSNNPFISQIVPVVGNAEYQISFWVKKESGVCDPVIKFEFWGDRTLAGASTVAETAVDAGREAPNEWKQHILTFRAPSNALDVTILVRILGEGVTYFDDISFYMTAPPSAFILDTDWVFYYSDWEKGTITSQAQLAFFPELTDALVDFSIKDGETVIFAKKGVVSENGIAGVDFDLSLLKEKKKKYIVEASIYGKDGKVLETRTQQIYKYDRPKYLREDGIFMKNGVEPIAPVFAYHCSHYPEAASAGINIVQGNAMTSVEAHLQYLNDAQKNGLMILVPLYVNMKPAGHIDNVETTIDVINAIKDHPALFGYAVMDEPFLAAENPERDMRNSYRLIRDLDDNHPVYTVEAVAGFYRTCSKYVDVLAIDPYGVATDRNSSNATMLALEAVKYQKPVWTLLEAFRHPDGHYPTGDEERNMIYQVLIAGSSAIGYYSFSDSEVDENGKYTVPIFEMDDIWSSINLYNEKEYKETFDHFVFGNSPAFNENRGDDFWYSSWVKGNDIYMAVLGMKKGQTINASVPLTDFSGTISVGDYTATVIAGAPEGTISGNGTLDVTLSGAQTVLYKITPGTPLDFSALGKTRLDDLASHSWARAQIARLDEKDIINKISTWSFQPGENITRADFAYFLIRTLGLTADSTEQFADVDPNKYCAMEIAIGKALGILNGVGDNKYNPEAAISRQDMMTIIARGMQLTGEADLSAFSDRDAIADYALECVKAMIASGLIKGNADGTINPRGNTTRAESAVIMARILDM